jgi:nucleotide-binding universal stress UspA family protein
MATRYYVDVGYLALPDLQKELEENARQQVDVVVIDDDRQRLHAESIVLAAASAARAIVDDAKDQGIDLIVIGTHGRGVVSRMLLGSVAERVVRTAPCPVLTVHGPERECSRRTPPQSSPWRDNACPRRASPATDNAGAMPSFSSG